MSTPTTAPNATTGPDEYFVQDCLSTLFDLENTYGVPNLVVAVVMLIDLCSCADDPAECAGCQIRQLVPVGRSSRQWLAVH